MFDKFCIALFAYSDHRGLIFALNYERRGIKSSSLQLTSIRLDFISSVIAIRQPTSGLR